jgi:hypothetical protein
MKNIIRQSLVVGGAVVALAGGAARADASETIKVNVPFAFTVRNQTLPAGEYLVRRDDTDPAVLLIQNVDRTHAGTFVLTNAAGGHDPTGDKSCLSFTRTGETYQLSSIWESPFEGHTVLGSK